MTAYELLWLYARLRGIPEADIRDAVEREIKRLDLVKHAKNTCGNYRYVFAYHFKDSKLSLILHYSGGNKRKLSTAVALVGSPSIVLLVSINIDMNFC